MPVSVRRRTEGARSSSQTAACSHSRPITGVRSQLGVTASLHRATITQADPALSAVYSALLGPSLRKRRNRAVTAVPSWCMPWGWHGSAILLTLLPVRGLLAVWVRSVNPMCDLLASISPALELAFDCSARSALILLTGFRAPACIRRAGEHKDPPAHRRTGARCSAGCARRGSSGESAVPGLR
jgi:hypothetical protein